MKFETDFCWNKLKSKISYDVCVKVIFGWVKQDKINPNTMASLLIMSYKKFN